MIVVDVEATGTDPEKHSLVSIGAVDFANPADTFYEECRIWDGAHIDPAALEVNGYSEEQIRDEQKQKEEELVQRFFDWVSKRAEQTIAGQNPSFDLGFIRAAAYRAHLDIKLAHRSIDLHSMVYFHMIKRGLVPPVAHNHSNINSDSIMAYVGIPAEPKPHIALNGAKWEAEAFSRLFYEKPLFDEFKQYKVPWLV